jgi:hypothetical protein
MVLRVFSDKQGTVCGQLAAAFAREYVAAERIWIHVRWEVISSNSEVVRMVQLLRQYGYEHWGRTIRETCLHDKPAQATILFVQMVGCDTTKGNLLVPSLAIFETFVRRTLFVIKVLLTFRF